jgi:hypothetical protein
MVKVNHLVTTLSQARYDTMEAYIITRLHSQQQQKKHQQPQTTKTGTVKCLVIF